MAQGTVKWYSAETRSGADAVRPAPLQSGRNKAPAADLSPLLAAVIRTRATQREIRATPGRHVDSLAAARRACLRAIEEYTTALELRCLPVPYQLHMELEMLRTVCASFPATQRGAGRLETKPR